MTIEELREREKLIERAERAESTLAQYRKHLAEFFLHSYSPELIQAAKELTDFTQKDLHEHMTENLAQEEVAAKTAACTSCSCRRPSGGQSENRRGGKRMSTSQLYFPNFL